MNSKKARNYLDLLVSVNLAKAKWKNLKDKFRIELKKIPECRSGSEAHEYKGKWPFFNMMMFMRDIVAPSNTEGNLGNSIPSAVTSDVDTDTEITITSPISPAPSNSTMAPQNSEPSFSRSSSRNTTYSTTTPVATRKKRKAEQSEIDEYIDIEKQKLQLLKNDVTVNEQLTKNPDYHFLMSLLPYFTEFDSIEKLEVRTGIQNLIMETPRRKKQRHLEYPVNTAYSSDITIISPATGDIQFPF